MVRVKYLLFLSCCFLITGLSTVQGAPESQTQTTSVRVAVASNFKPVLEQLITEFKRQKPSIKIQLSSASSGVLYAQILRGAPFDLFLSADRLRPTLLEEQNIALTNSRQTYARGKLVLWSSDQVVQDINDVRQYDGKIAIANPEFAPFGRASQQVLSALGLWSDKNNNVVMTNNVLQVAHLLHSGAVNLGMVSASQVRNVPDRQLIFVPENWYSPIEQQVVIINHSKSEENHKLAVESFYRFILSRNGQQIIANNGYGVTIQSNTTDERRSD